MMLQTPVVDAARLLAERRLPGLIVVDDADHPIAVLPGSQVLRHIIPTYVQDDPALARVLDEESGDHLLDAIADRTVGDILPKDRQLPIVMATNKVVEIAANMARERSPIVAVVEDDVAKGALIGAISVAHLLEVLLSKPVQP